MGGTLFLGSRAPARPVPLTQDYYLSPLRGGWPPNLGVKQTSEFRLTDRDIVSSCGVHGLSASGSESVSIVRGAAHIPPGRAPGRLCAEVMKSASWKLRRSAPSLKNGRGYQNNGRGYQSSLSVRFRYRFRPRGGRHPTIIPEGPKTLKRREKSFNEPGTRTWNFQCWQRWGNGASSRVPTPWRAPASGH